MKRRSTKASASVLPSSTPSPQSVSFQLPPILRTEHLTKILSSDSASASRAVKPSMPPLPSHVPSADHLPHNLALLALSGISPTSNTYTSHVAALHNTQDDAGDGGETNVVARRFTFSAIRLRPTWRGIANKRYRAEAVRVLKGM